MIEQRETCVTSCNTELNKDRSVEQLACKEQRLWIINFSIKDKGEGCAVVKARNPKDAEILLKSQGSFNGIPYKYKITRIEEIIPSPDSMLIAEQIALYKYIEI